MSQGQPNLNQKIYRKPDEQWFFIRRNFYFAFVIKWFFGEKSSLNGFGCKEKQGKSNGHIWENSYLKNDRVKQMKENGNNKNRHSGAFPQQQRNNKQIKENPHISNAIVHPSLLQKITNEPIIGLARH